MLMPWGKRGLDGGPKPESSMLCAIFLNHQHCLENKNDIIIPKQIAYIGNSKNGIAISVGQAVLELLIKTVFCLI